MSRDVQTKNTDVMSPKHDIILCCRSQNTKEVLIPYPYQRPQRMTDVSGASIDWFWTHSVHEMMYTVHGETSVYWTTGTSMHAHQFTILRQSISSPTIQTDLDRIERELRTTYRLGVGISLKQVDLPQT